MDKVCLRLKGHLVEWLDTHWFALWEYLTIDDRCELSNPPKRRNRGNAYEAGNLTPRAGGHCSTADIHRHRRVLDTS